jgi:hypothetical protein
LDITLAGIADSVDAEPPIPYDAMIITKNKCANDDKHIIL